MSDKLMIYVPEDLGDDARMFFEHYQLHTAIYCKTSRREKPRNNKKTVCRFCGKTGSEVRFTKQAHIIPRFLGNRNFTAYDECDDCNQLFSAYEDDLAHFFGVSRTLYKMKGRRGVPKFKSADRTPVIVEEHEPPTDTRLSSVLVKSETLATNVMTIDLLQGCVEIPLVKPSYTPVNVYKALVKMAISLMPEQELVNFTHTLRYLTEPGFHRYLKGMAVAHIQQTEYWYEEPVAYLFKKTDPASKSISYLFALHAHNQFIQVAVPLYAPDLALYRKPSEISVRFAPLFVTTIPTGNFRRTGAQIIDLQSDEPKVGDTEIFRAEFTMKKEDEAFLRANPDIAESVLRQKIVAAKIHFGSNNSMP